MAKKTVSKSVKTTKTQPQFTCTPEQEAAAVFFVKRSIEIQKIVGPLHAGSGCYDILSQIEAEYHASTDELLRHQKRLRIHCGEGPATTARIREEGLGVLLDTQSVLKNGPLAEQEAREDYLFAINDSGAIAYEIRKAGKSQFTLTVFYDISFTGNETPSRDAQLIDLYTGAFDSDAQFRCDLCGETTDTLYLSYDTNSFGCVRCQTALNTEETARYQKTLKATPRAVKKGGVR